MSRRAVGRGHRWLAALVLAVLLAAPAIARAQADPIADADAGAPLTDPLPGADYDPDSTAWNGLARLVALARGMGLEVYTPEEINWDELGSGDILVILYPTLRLQPTHVAAFVRNGGRLLLADDFGDSRETLGYFSILRGSGAAVDAKRYAADRSYAPIATAWLPDHPLADGAPELVTNHPAVLRDVSGAEVVYGFGEDEGVIAAGKLDAGRIIISSDPSIFINRMLQFPGNLQFAANAIRWLMRPGTTSRLVIMSGQFEVWGEPEGLLDDGTVGGKVNNTIANFNRWLRRNKDYLLTKQALLALSIVLALMVALGAVVIVPLRRKTALDGSWTRGPGGGGGVPDFERVVGMYDRPGPRQSYTLPAAILRDIASAELERVLESPEPLHGLSETELYRRLHEARGEPAVAAMRPLYARLKALPSRWQAASPFGVSYVSRREFERLRSEVDALEKALRGK